MLKIRGYVERDEDSARFLVVVLHVQDSCIRRNVSYRISQIRIPRLDEIQSEGGALSRTPVPVTFMHIR